MYWLRVMMITRAKHSWLLCNVTLKIYAFGFSSWRVGVGSASAVRPHTTARQRLSLADGFGTGVWSAPDTRPGAGPGAEFELAGACGACRAAGSGPGRAARGRALRNQPQIKNRSVAPPGMQQRG